MIGERKNTYPNTDYGTLTMRAFDIDGNEINAFYDAQNNLVFVLDNTLSAQKPNVLLVINPDGDKKWDEILSNDYGIDLETIRPKVDNKYQKLDIEYSGLPVYENLINAYNAGKGLEEQLGQLAILRDSAARHSAMTRLNVANETISKTNATIVKTKETIVRLETRIKTLRSNLSAEKKSIGKVNTKQSASKILKLESQIEATNEKLKRAKKRLESAQRRLEAATVDAELASDLLNQPSVEIKQKPKSKSKPVMVAPKYPVQTIEDDEEEVPDDDDDEYVEDEEDVAESDVKPLFAEDPQILNDNIAFKPIEFNAPVFPVEEPKDEPLPVIESKPVVESDDAPLESRPVLESFTPVEVPSFVPEPITEEKTEVIEERPVLETMKPVETDAEIDVQIDEPVVEPKPVEPVAPIVPVVNNFKVPEEVKAERSKPGFVYYVLLFVLIVLSVFTLWLYQKNMTTDSTPVLATKVSETTVMKPASQTTVSSKSATEESVFLTDAPSDEKKVEEIESDEDVEPVEEETEFIDVAPVVMDAVPGRLNTSGLDSEDEEGIGVSEEDILANKPVYEPGTKHDNIFVNEKKTSAPDVVYEPEPAEYEFIDDPYYDAEEAAYQAEMGY